MSCADAALRVGVISRRSLARLRLGRQSSLEDGFLKRFGFQNQSGIKPGRVCKNNSNNTLTMFERLALHPAFLAVGCLDGVGLNSDFDDVRRASRNASRGKLPLTECYTM